MPNYYQILELPYNASASDIKKAYREKAKHCHPDVSRSEKAKRDFQLINQAYSTLSNAEKRRKYDLLLFYRYSVLHEYSKKKKQRRREAQDRQRKRRRQARTGANGKSMTSTARGYRYFKPDPSPLFKFGIYLTGNLFGIALFILTTFSLFANGWPLLSAFILVPAWIMTYQGWNGVREHRNGAGRNILDHWGRFLKMLGQGKERS